MARKKKVVSEATDVQPREGLKTQREGGSMMDKKPLPKIKRELPRTNPVSHSLADVKQKIASQRQEAEKVAQQVAASAENLKQFAFTLDDLQVAWNQFADQQESRLSQVVLKNASLSLENHEIKVGLENSLQISQFQNIQVLLRSYLIEKLENNQFTFKIELIEHSDDKTPRLYTQQEKYTYLVEKYPALQVLTQQLGLDWEH